MIVQIIEGDVVTNVIAVDGTASIEDAGARLTWSEGEMEAPAGTVFMLQEGAGIGWTLAADFLSPPDMPIVFPTPAELIAYANAVQWRRATGGCLIWVASEAVPFSTTEASMSLIAGKVARLNQPNAPTAVNWQIGPVTFKEIAAADFLVASVKIADFIQSTFDALPPIFAGIADGTITTTAEIDAAFA